MYESFDFVVKNKAVHWLDNLTYDLENNDGNVTAHSWNLLNKPVTDKYGNLRYFLHIREDITATIEAAKKKKENALLQNEQKLRSLIMQSPVAMCILTGPLFIVEVANDSVLALWGKTRPEVIDKPMFVARPEAKDQGLEQLLQQVYTSGVLEQTMACIYRTDFLRSRWPVLGWHYTPR